MKKLKLALLLTVSTQLACAHSSEVVITELLSTTQCPINREGITFYPSKREFAAALERDKKVSSQLLDSVSDSTENNTNIELPPETSAIVVNTGAKPSLGYKIELARPVGVIEGGTLKIKLNERTPEAQSSQASVMTMPCVVIVFKKQKIINIAASSNLHTWKTETHDNTPQ